MEILQASNRLSLYKVSISIYDVLGKEVIQVIDEKQNAGEHQLNINTEQLQNGIYFVKMGVNAVITTQKILINHN